LYYAPAIKKEISRRQELAKIEAQSRGITTARSDYVIPVLEQPVPLLTQEIDLASGDQERRPVQRLVRSRAENSIGATLFRPRNLPTNSRMVRGRDADELLWIDSNSRSSVCERLDLPTGRSSPIGPPNVVDMCRCSEGIVFVSRDGSLVLCPFDNLDSGVHLNVPGEVRHRLGTSRPDGSDRFEASGIVSSPDGPIVYVIQKSPSALWAFDLQRRELIAHSVCFDEIRLLRHSPPSRDLLVFDQGNAVLAIEERRIYGARLRGSQLVMNDQHTVIDGFGGIRLKGPLATLHGERFLISRFRTSEEIAAGKTMTELIDPHDLAKPNLPVRGRDRFCAITIAGQSILLYPVKKHGDRDVEFPIWVHRITDMKPQVTIVPEAKRSVQRIFYLGEERILIQSGLDLVVLDLGNALAEAATHPHPNIRLDFD
jgi:hypothetical protein